MGVFAHDFHPFVVKLVPVLSGGRVMLGVVVIGDENSLSCRETVERVL
jgi:hypothetical protein